MKQTKIEQKLCECIILNMDKPLLGNLNFIYVHIYAPMCAYVEFPRWC